VTVLVHPESNTVSATAIPTTDVPATAPMGLAVACFIEPL
jgi:hypothetical protein